MRAREAKRTGKAVFWTIVGTFVVILVVLLIIPLTGAVNVAATQPHLPVVHWFLDTLQERSVADRAGTAPIPEDLSAPHRVSRGLRHYHRMCVMCHGAPGVQPAWVGQGLNPNPPELWQAAEREIGEADAARDFWVIKHGIRMTGMPALAPTHGDDEIWDLVAFLQHLPEMSPDAYASEVREAGLSLNTPGGHDHGERPAEDEPSPEPHDHDEHQHGGRGAEESDEAGDAQDGTW